MKRNYSEMPNGYLETIQKGIAGVRTFGSGISRGTGTRAENLKQLKKEIETADAIVIGAGAGLSTAAGFTYSGERFEKYFADAERHYGFHDMYSGGFYPYPSPEKMWAVWSRNIYINRYMDPPKPVYEDLLKLVTGKDYFVITTNVDHCFQKAGFDKKRLFYTQGDYGLFQCSEPCHDKTYDNEEIVRKMVLSQGFTIHEDGRLSTLEETPDVKLEIPSELIPYCPVCKKPMALNLRSDDTFVEDEGWHRASAAYSDFLRRHDRLHVLFLEIGIGANTPVICKYPFWQMTNDNKNAVYACLNYNEAYCPKQIEKQSIVIDGDSGDVIRQLLQTEA